MTRLRVMATRVLDLVLHRRRDDRLNAEIDLHLVLLAEEAVRRGLTPEAARAEACRRFGGVDEVKARCRDQRRLPTVDALRQDARFAARVLMGDRGFTTTAVLVLALGIGVNNMMFTILNAHTIRGLPIDDVDRVMYVSTVDAGGTERGLSWPEFDQLRGAARFTELGAFVTSPVGLAGEHEAPDRVNRATVSSGLLTLLGIRPIRGRTLTPGDAEPGATAVAVISEELWRSKYGAEPGTVGRTILVDGGITTIVGILPRASGFPAVADAWQPLEQTPGLQATTRGVRTLRVVGRARPGVDVDTARAELEAAFVSDATSAAAAADRVRARVVPINDRFLGRLLDPAWLAFMAVGCLVALISCANVANLLLGRALLRDREIALRAALGATRPRIVRQLLLESLLLAAAGGALGLVAGIAGVRLFRSGIPANVLPYWLDYTIDARVILALIAASTVATAVFGLIPAVQTSRTDPQATLRQGGPTMADGRNTNRWTAAILVVEIALGVVMLANLALAWRVTGARPVSDAMLYRTDILTATLTVPGNRYGDADARRSFLQRLDEELRGAPGIQQVAVASALPVVPVPERQLRARAVETMAPIGVRHVAVTAAYFELLGLGIREGHSFGAGHPSDVLINETLANRLFPGRDAIGQRIGFVSAQEEAAGEWFTVAGVVPFIRQRPSSEPEPILYQSLAAAPPATVSILVRHRLEPEAATALLRDVARRLDPRLPLYSVSTLRRGTLDAEWNGRISSRLLFALTAIAVLLGGVGLYAVTARAVASRRREIGIRVAIGAGTRQVAGLVLTRAIVTVAAGLVVGTLGVVAWEAAFRPAARSRDVVPGAALADPFVLLSISAVLAIVTITACLAPIRRAQRVSPAVALRCE